MSATALSRFRGHAAKRLKVAILITSTILAAEAIGGYFTNSLALLSDAGHVLSDLFALFLSFLAIKLAARSPTEAKSYGYYRAEILAALTNGVVLVVVSLLIFYEAFGRMLAPEPVRSLEVLIIASIGLVSNMGGIVVLRGLRKSINIRGALLHIVGDTLSSIGVIVGSLIILFTSWFIVDPLISFIIGIIILTGSYRLINEAVNILLEATPSHIKIDEVLAAIKSVKGVREAHDIHVWMITSDLCCMSGHVVAEAEDLKRVDEILGEIKEKLLGLGIHHATIEVHPAMKEVRLH